MANETDNLILTQLREIRAQLNKLDEHDKRFDAIDRRFDGIDKTLETLKFQMTYTYGAAGLAGVNSLGAEAKADAALKRLDANDNDLAEVKRRLKALEDANQ
jgi:hypothetical protein